MVTTVSFVDEMRKGDRVEGRKRKKRPLKRPQEVTGIRESRDSNVSDGAKRSPQFVAIC